MHVQAPVSAMHVAMLDVPCHVGARISRDLKVTDPFLPCIVPHSTNIPSR